LAIARIAKRVVLYGQTLIIISHSTRWNSEPAK
jgi:hypothetical protein